MSKYTKGPWKADTMGIYIFGPDEGGGQTVAMTRGTGYMSSTLGYSDEQIEEEQKANAALISAAPELLEALKELQESYWIDDPDRASDAIMAAGDAIAKAEGRE